MAEVQGRERLLREFRLGGETLSVAWSPDGTRLATAGCDARVYVLTAEGRLLWRGERHEGLILSVAWSPDGCWLASGSADCTVRLWDPASGAELRCCFGHVAWTSSVAWVMSVACSADGRGLASGSADRTVRLWDPGQRPGSRPGRPSCEWSPGHRLLPWRGLPGLGLRRWHRRPVGCR